MQVACGILTTIFLILSNNFSIGYVLAPNENNNKVIGETFRAWNSLFITVFDSNDVEQNFTLNIENLGCFSSYESKKHEIFYQTGEEILQCAHISLEELQNYFKRHYWRRFKKYLLRDAKRCKDRRYEKYHYQECLSDVLLSSLENIKLESWNEKRKTKACIRIKLTKLFNDLKQNSETFKFCLTEQSFENPWNTSTPASINNTWSPWPNTTLSPWPNSTWYPWPNTTVSPWPNSTWSPWPNTTWSPWPNSTWNPWPNTTVSPWPNSSWNPWRNTTVSPWPNTTWSPWLNTSWNPWQNSTWNPTSNITSITHITTTIVSATPSATEEPAIPWWKKIWDKIISIF